MTTFLAYIFIPAFLLVLAFVVGVVVVVRRSHYRGTYAPSPYSRVTPLGTYTPRQVRKNVTQADIQAGIEMARLREYAARYPTWLPIEEAETVKVEVRRD